MPIVRTNIAICTEHKKLSHAQLAKLGFHVDAKTIYSTSDKANCQVCKSIGKATLVVEGQVMQGANSVKAKNVNEPITERRKTRGRAPSPAENDALMAARAKVNTTEAGKVNLVIDIALTDAAGEIVDRYIKVYKAKATTARATYKQIKEALDMAGKNMEREG